jgi:NAD(P)-dependent dehydrogenase (short-subunit alcohol dehydrogenase family)
MKAPAKNHRPVALVTGASRGIGRVTAMKLAARGVRIAVHYRRDRVAAAAVLSSLPGDGHFLIACDLGRRGGAEKLFAATLKKSGRLDLLVNSAGIYETHPIGEVKFAAWQKAWDRALAINLLAPTHLTFLASEHMSHHGGGRIINVSSRGAYGGQTRTAAYSAAKAGLNSMSQSFARSGAAEGVLVFVVAPSWVDTDMAAPHIHGPRKKEILEGIPLGRVTTPDEVASTIAWLALDAPAAMTGAIVDINGAVHLRH